MANNKVAYSSSASTASSSIRTLRPKPHTHMRTGITGNKSRLLMFHQIIDVLWSIAVTTLVRAATRVNTIIY
jgi:hypothetical protein